MRALVSAAVLALLAVVLGIAIGGGVRAQDGRPGAVERPVVDPDTDATVLRTRGASAWRNYVWSLRRPRLAIAVAELERARELNDGRADFTQLYLIAFGHLILGNAEPGRAAAAEVRAMAPQSPKILLLDAFDAILEGESKKALATLDGYVGAIERAPQDSALAAEFRFLGYLHRGAQRHAAGIDTEAVDDLRTAARIAEEAGRVPASELLLRRAQVHQSLDEAGAATEIVLELLRRDPGNADLYHNMGLLEATQQRMPEAQLWYERAIARRRDLVSTHGKLAFLAWREAEAYPAQLPVMRRHLAAYGELVRAKSTKDDLADLESGLGTYWLCVARHRAELRSVEAARPAYERAIRHFEAALGHEPGCVRALNSIIQIGGELRWPPERLEPFRERMNAILQREDGAPTANRSSFC